MAISLGKVVVPFPKRVINLPRTYEKLQCKGEQYHSPVSKILLYKQTDMHPVTSIIYLYMISNFFTI